MNRDDRHSRTRLAFFVPDFTDISTIKRSEAFLDRGYALTVFGFRRERYNRDYDPPWPHVRLGRTTDGQYGQRLRALVLAATRLPAHRQALAGTGIFYARNIDQLLLALLAAAISGSRARIVYEVLDIQPAFVGKGMFSRLVRLVERLCLRRVSLLVLSSPGFLRHYFVPVQRYQRPWFLLENKLPPSVPSRPALGDADTERRRRRRLGYRWVVGYYGLIRGDETLALMARLAERLRGIVLFRFRGILTTIDQARFDELLCRHPNIIYDGEYVSPRDLARIYGEIDFAWAIDLENADSNSRWLLPCRFYEAGYYGVPCLAANGFEVGGLVERLGVGWTFDAPYVEAMEEFLRNVSAQDHAARRRRLLDLPPERFVAGEDMAELCATMETGIARHPAATSIEIAAL